MAAGKPPRGTREREPRAPRLLLRTASTHRPYDAPSGLHESPPEPEGYRCSSSRLVRPTAWSSAAARLVGRRLQRLVMTSACGAAVAMKYASGERSCAV